jgi:hypothetical protein
MTRAVSIRKARTPRLRSMVKARSMPGYISTMARFSLSERKSTRARG